jgi:hypothetical protein
MAILLDFQDIEINSRGAGGIIYPAGGICKRTVGGFEAD